MFKPLLFGPSGQIEDLFYREGWEYILEKHGGRLPVKIKAMHGGRWWTPKCLRGMWQVRSGFWCNLSFFEHHFLEGIGI